MKDMKRGTRRRYSKRMRGRRRGIAIAALGILVSFATLTLLFPQSEEQKEEHEVRYYISDDYYYTNYKDYQEACRQRDEYHRIEAEAAEAEAQAIIEAREAYDEQCQKQAEAELKMSRAFYQYPEPFNAPPIIWTDDELEGFQEYQIPDDYTASGGYFPDIIQEYTWVICQREGVQYDKVVALIEQETGYQYDAIGDAEDSGYTQVVRKYHEDLIAELGVTDLKNPYQNIEVCVVLLKRLLDKYDGSYAKALTAYNAGADGAYRYYFSAGVDASPYARKVLCRAKRIRTEMEEQNATEN